VIPTPVNVGGKTKKEIDTKVKAVKAEVKAKGYTFKVDHTRAMDFKLERLCGTKPPKDVKQQAAAHAPIAEKTQALAKEAREKFMATSKVPLPLVAWLKIMPKPTISKFDWVDKGKVTRVKDQSDCGSCWAFGSIAAFESSYAIHNNQLVEASEQQILDCSKAGSCCGGWLSGVFDYLVKHGCARADAYNYYRPGQGCCHEGIGTPLRAISWAYVNPKHPEKPTVNEIKAALVRYGPLACGVNATGAFQGYTSGVFNENAKGGINHCVCITGWDESKKAWHVKNSWSTGWGEKGYIWIRYGSNQIGAYAAHVSARTIYYPVPKRFFTLHAGAKPFPAAVPFKGSTSKDKDKAKTKDKDKSK
jgi:cathepsin L